MAVYMVGFTGNNEMIGDDSSEPSAPHMAPHSPQNGRHPPTNPDSDRGQCFYLLNQDEPNHCTPRFDSRECPTFKLLSGSCYVKHVLDAKGKHLMVEIKRPIKITKKKIIYETLDEHGNPLKIQHDCLSQHI